MLILLIHSSNLPHEAKYTRCRASSILNPASFITSVASTTGCSSGTDSQDPGLTDGHSRNIANMIPLHKTNNDLNNILMEWTKQITLSYAWSFDTITTGPTFPLYMHSQKLLVLKMLPSSSIFLNVHFYLPILLKTSSAKIHSLRSYHTLLFCHGSKTKNLFQAYYSYSYYFSKYDNHIAIFRLCHQLTIFFFIMRGPSLMLRPTINNCDLRKREREFQLVYGHWPEINLSPLKTVHARGQGRQWWVEGGSWCWGAMVL